MLKLALSPWPARSIFKTPAPSALKSVPKGFKVINVATGSQTIPANSTKTIYLEYLVLNEVGEDNMQIAFNSAGLKDAFNQR